MRGANLLLGLVLVIAGGFCLIGSLRNSDFLYNNFRGRFLAARLGPRGMRAFYIVVGAALLILGVLTLLDRA